MHGNWWNIVLVRVVIATMKRHDNKLEMKEFIWLIRPHWSPLLMESGEELKQGRNLEAGTDAEAMEGCGFLACSPWLAQPVFL